MVDHAPVWVLLTKGVGDNNQLLRLANELGVPFRTIDPRYNLLHLVPPKLLGASLASLKREAREELRPPWPDLVLGIGFRTTPTALAIRELSGGSTRLVRLGNPRVDPRRFDVVVTTPQYAVPDAPNLIRLPLGVSTAPHLEATAEERDWLDRLPQPRRLLLIGGNTFMWTLSPATVSAAAREIARKPGGSVIAVSSRRTSRAIKDAAARALNGTPHALVWGEFPRYPIVVDAADELYVTGDSVSMISDAVATGKPVGIVHPQKSLEGRFLYTLARLFGGRVPIRDVGGFLDLVLENGLAGSVREPIAGRMELDPLATAVAAVRPLLQVASARRSSQPR